jgi:hypothetical protein
MTTYPLLTPSTCKSTHHTPGIPNISHSAAYLIVAIGPVLIHSRKQKYTTETTSRGGNRARKRKMETGHQSTPVGAGGTGRKGAIAVPAVVLLVHEACVERRDVCAYLYRGTDCTSPCFLSLGKVNCVGVVSPRHVVVSFVWKRNKHEQRQGGKTRVCKLIHCAIRPAAGKRGDSQRHFVLWLVWTVREVSGHTSHAACESCQEFYPESS